MICPWHPAGVQFTAHAAEEFFNLVERFLQFATEDWRKINHDRFELDPQRCRSPKTCRLGYRRCRTGLECNTHTVRTALATVTRRMWLLGPSRLRAVMHWCTRGANGVSARSLFGSR